MNFLSMCQRLVKEAGIPGSGPATTSNQSGILKSVVEWIQSADEDIQNLHSDWQFLVRCFEFSTTSGQQVYTPIEAGVSDLNQWRCNDYDQISCRIAYSDEQFMIPLSWREFKRIYLNGTYRSVAGRPQFFAIQPDKSMVLYPIPDAEYSIAGEYSRKAQTLTNNTDEPLYPSEYHMIAVWRALMFYGAYDAADERYKHGQNEYRRILSALHADQMPSISWGNPLV
jgi:hypothetical protein